jgi:hypothetical protein
MASPINRPARMPFSEICKQLVGIYNRNRLIGSGQRASIGGISFCVAAQNGFEVNRREFLPSGAPLAAASSIAPGEGFFSPVPGVCLKE